MSKSASTILTRTRMRARLALLDLVKYAGLNACNVYILYADIGGVSWDPKQGGHTVRVDMLRRQYGQFMPIIILRDVKWRKHGNLRSLTLVLEGRVVEMQIVVRAHYEYM
jgi:hypothetical protein